MHAYHLRKSHILLELRLICRFYCFTKCVLMKCNISINNLRDFAVVVLITFSEKTKIIRKIRRKRLNEPWSFFFIFERDGKKIKLFEQSVAMCNKVCIEFVIVICLIILHLVIFVIFLLSFWHILFNECTTIFYIHFWKMIFHLNLRHNLWDYGQTINKGHLITPQRFICL